MTLAEQRLERLRNQRPRLISDYALDPVRFAQEILGAHPAPYQVEILEALVTHRRVAARGPHGLGKTALAAWAVLWFASTHAEAKIPTTASAWRQLTKFLWPEIHKWARQAHWRRLGLQPQLLTLNLRFGDTCEAFAVASDKPELIEGAHAAHLLYVFDEAKAIKDAVWDAAEGAFASGDCHALAISTPGARAGRFYDIHRRALGLEDWWVRHVTCDEAIAAGRVSPAWVEARKKQWGEHSPIFQQRVLGEFPEQAEDTLISLAWIEAARERELLLGTETVAGLDVARFGDDDSALVQRCGPVVLSAETWQGHDTMFTTGKARATRAPVNVDVIGVGAGVYDRLHEQQHPCSPINVGGAPIDRERFENLRAELYWNLRERFQSGEIDLSRLAPAAYDRLSGELTAMKFHYASSGRIMIEPKADMKARLGRSPDLADALALAFAPTKGACVAFVV